MCCGLKSGNFEIKQITTILQCEVLQHIIDLILGEIWLGLETLHKLTSAGSYSLHILMKDFDQKTYVAVYDQFKVIMMLRW